MLALAAVKSLLGVYSSNILKVLLLEQPQLFNGCFCHDFLINLQK